MTSGDITAIVGLLFGLALGFLLGWTVHMGRSYERLMRDRDDAWERLAQIHGVASGHVGKSQGIGSYSVEQDGTIVASDGRRYTRDEEGNLSEVQ